MIKSALKKLEKLDEKYELAKRDELETLAIPLIGRAVVLWKSIVKTYPQLTEMAMGNRSWAILGKVFCTYDDNSCEYIDASDSSFGLVPYIEETERNERYTFTIKISKDLKEFFDIVNALVKEFDICYMNGISSKGVVFESSKSTNPFSYPSVSEIRKCSLYKKLKSAKIPIYISEN